MTGFRGLIGAVLVMLMSVAGAARADQSAIRDTIASQLDAFQRNDLEGAFSHASPVIKRMFVTPQRFGEMVRNGYPMVWRPSSVRFGLLEERGGRPYQSVILSDAAGRSYVAEYEMVELDGEWQINGVRIRRAEDTGV